MNDEKEMNLVIMDMETLLFTKSLILTFYMLQHPLMTQKEQETSMKSLDAFEAAINASNFSKEIQEQDEWTIPKKTWVT
jgi:hypothetical protein